MVEMSAKPIPNQYDSLIPYLCVKDAAKAIEFYKSVFGATELVRMPTPDGAKVMHAELLFRKHVLMLGEENPQMGALGPQQNGPPPPASVMFYVDDVDGLFEKAAAHGAKSLQPPTDMFWGDRYAKFLDPFGHLWGIATHIRDVSPEEMAKAATEWAKKNKP
jgi:PhnB protein